MGARGLACALLSSFLNAYAPKKSSSLESTWDIDIQQSGTTRTTKQREARPVAGGEALPAGPSPFALALSGFRPISLPLPRRPIHARGGAPWRYCTWYCDAVVLAVAAAIRYPRAPLRVLCACRLSVPAVHRGRLCAQGLEYRQSAQQHGCWLCYDTSPANACR